MIYGISAGALNAAFMVNEAGRQHKANGTINWDLVNKKLLQFWLENITKTFGYRYFKVEMDTWD